MNTLIHNIDNTVQPSYGRVMELAMLPADSGLFGLSQAPYYSAQHRTHCFNDLGVGVMVMVMVATGNDELERMMAMGSDNGNG